MKLSPVIARLGEVVLAFVWGDGFQDLGDGIADGVDAPGGGFPEEMLELGEEFFDRVEVGRVFRQEDQPRTSVPYGLTYGLGFVGTEIVHDHDVAGAQCRHEHLFDIDEEAFPVDRPVDEPRRVNPVMAQRGQEGHGIPVAEGSLADQALTTRRPAPQRRHIGLGPGLVDEDQPGRVDAGAMLQPLPSSMGDVRAVLFAGNQRLFL